MKKRIIALILVVVMAVTLLAGCGAYNFAEEDLSNYVEVNYQELRAALDRIEIKDGDFTTNEETRKKKVEESILSAIAATIIKNSSTFEDDKLETGALNTERDVLYYCYYATDADGRVYYYSNMKEASITASSTKALHVIQLADYADSTEVDSDASANDKLLAAIAKAVKEKGFDFGTDEAKNGYGMLVSSDFEKTEDRAVAVGDTIVVSYTREYNIYETDANGEFVLDENGDKKIKSTKKETAVFEKITVGDNDTANKGLAACIKALIDENANGGVDTNDDGKGDKKNTVNVGATIIHPTGTSSANKKLEVPGKVVVTEGEGENAVEREIDITYTYSDVKVEWKLDSKYAGNEITFTHTPYPKTTQNVQPDSPYTTGQKVDLKEKELTYHVLPVYYLSIPEVSAETIVRYALADKVSATSFEVFTSEEYKNGDVTLKTLVEDLVKLYKEEYEDGSDLAAKLDALEKAEKELKDAGDDATDEQEEAVETAEKAYVTAQRAAIDAQVKKVAEAKRGEEAVADVIVEEHKDSTYHTLREEYDEDIISKVESEVYEILFKNDNVAKVKDYPEKLVKKFSKHLYDSYEEKFYKEEYKAEGSTTSSGESNYKHYDGDFDAYLAVATGASKYNNNVDAAIEAEAKAAIEPLLKLYAIAKLLDDKGAAKEVVSFIMSDINNRAYDVNYTYDETLSEKENKKAEEKAKEQARETREEALKNAENFLVTDEVYKDYKKALGSTAARQYEKEYGEINIRAALQFNRLFYYLASTELEYDEEEEHPHTAYKLIVDDGEVTKVLSFKNLSYTIADAEEEDKTDSNK